MLYIAQRRPGSQLAFFNPINIATFIVSSSVVNISSDITINQRVMVYMIICSRLADLANFYEFATKTFQLSEKNKWISYGGSYPGSLSAWYRIKVNTAYHIY